MKKQLYYLFLFFCIRFATHLLMILRLSEFSLRFNTYLMHAKFVSVSLLIAQGFLTHTASLKIKELHANEMVIHQLMENTTGWKYLSFLLESTLILTIENRQVMIVTMLLVNSLTMAHIVLS